METATILIADPRDAERKLLAYLLAHEGFSVVEARSSIDTIRAAQTPNVKLILLETALWQSSEMNALVTLKHHPRTKTIPVVLYGQPRNREDLVCGIQAGAAEWVVRRGFEVDTFLKKIFTVLNGNDASEEEPSAQPAIPVSRDLEGLSAARLADVVKNIQHLCPFEFNIAEAIGTSACENPAEERLADVSLRDPMLMLALLACGNAKSRADGFDAVTDAQHAVQIIGPDRFQALAESLKPSTVGCNAGWNPAQYWAHSVATSRIAEMLSTRLELGTPSDARTTGLLHDIGYCLLAHHFPRHLESLISTSRNDGEAMVIREDAIIGTRHGDLGKWAAIQFGLPDVIADVVAAHHESPSSCQTMKVTSRVLALVVQAADQMADALFPGDMPLTPLNRLSEEFHTAWSHLRSDPDAILAEARRIMAELTTEMAYMFPGSVESAGYYSRRPLERLVYVAPGHRKLDVIQTFFEIRTTKLEVIDQIRKGTKNETAPMVVNLSHLPEVSSQVEALTSLMAAGVMRNRRGLLLVSGDLNPVYRNFITGDWNMVTLPTSPALWMPWLADEGDADEATISPHQNTEQPSFAP